MIQIEDLIVRYKGDHKAIDGLSLSVGPGEFVLLTGPSGCGKSTLARCLNGLIPHASQAAMAGHVAVDGVSTTEQTVAQMATRVGLVFQNPSTQLFGSTVDEEVAFGPRNLGLPPQEVAERTAFALAATRIEHLRERDTKSLSAGEQQRVAIAAVLSMRPKVLALDEPTSNLDLKGTRAVLETLAHLRREYGLTILIIEHRLSEAGALANRVVVMDEGKILLDGPTQTIFRQREVLSQLGIRYPEPTHEALPLQVCPQRVPFEGHALKPIVEMVGVQAGYESGLVLRDLNFAVYPQEFVALVGDNGAGKTTVARLLAGLLKPQQGAVAWNDDLRRLPLGRRAGLLFQNPLQQLFCDSVEEEVAFGPDNFGLRSNGRLETILGVAGLADLRARNPYALSVGQQQRVALASILALEPALLILDEPTMGQDWGSLSRVMDFLTRLNGHGQAILLITHDHKLVCRYADRILLLEDGRLSNIAPGAGPFHDINGQRESLHEVLGA
ncbi:MAG: energy-coupling factor transporter ATPase [Anaerolineae bacterium]|nr:energy-coupling factor transporter ATPase [Anaerolineae bacterium]